MSKKLPLEIQRNYTISNEKDHWKLKCHVCNQAWQLNKPKKGEDIHGGNILALLDHAASHPLPLPQEDAVVEVSVTPPTESKPELSPISHVNVHPKRGAGHDYAVEWFGSSSYCHMVKVSHFKEAGFELYDTVLRVTDNHYRVVIKAANQKHAQLVGERLIHKHFNQQQQKASM